MKTKTVTLEKWNVKAKVIDGKLYLYGFAGGKGWLETPLTFVKAELVRAVNKALGTSLDKGAADNAEERVRDMGPELLEVCKSIIADLSSISSWQSCDTGNTGAECDGEKCFMAEHRAVCLLEKVVRKAESK